MNRHEGGQGKEESKGNTTKEEYRSKLKTRSLLKEGENQDKKIFEAGGNIEETCQDCPPLDGNDLGKKMGE